MAESFTRATLFIPGTPASEEAWNSGLSSSGLRIEGGELRGNDLPPEVGVEWVENDGHFGDAFSFGTVSPEVIEALDGAPGALVVYWPVDLREGRKVIVQAVEGLRDAGALAVRLEQSRLGWDVSRWLELVSDDDPWSWHKAFIAYLSGDTTLQSVGMHVFSLPDVSVPVGGELQDPQEFASVLNVYQFDEDPVLLSGHTFAPDTETPKQGVERWPDTQYPDTHACNNPYGVWRIVSPDDRARPPMSDPGPVFIPALRVLLRALELKEAEALSKERVESVRDEGTCIVMDQKDAQGLERTRGYADLDPELIWEQWQLVREQG